MDELQIWKTRCGEMAAEIERLLGENNTLVADNRRHMRMVSSLQAVIDEANAQEPIRYLLTGKNGELVGKLFMTKESAEKYASSMLVGDFDATPAFIRPIPAQQVPDAIKLLQRVAASTTESITAQQSPAVAVPDDWEAVGGDYDKSIHSNPSADAWAEFFIKTFPRLKHKRDLIQGWFANAMMAMHDSIPSPRINEPAVAVPESVTNAQIHGSKYPEWQCFHCGEVFNTVGGAAQHFGADPTKKPGCMLKVEIGKERGLLWEYRELETKYDLLRAQVANGTTEIENSAQEMITNNRIALCKAEEDEYNKGLRDGMSQSLRIAEREAPGIDFEDLQCKKNDPLHMAVSNWYARLTGCAAVADEGEHVGYCCPMKMMDELEEILAAPAPKQEPVLIGHWDQDPRFNEIDYVGGILRGSFPTGTAIFAQATPEPERKFVDLRQVVEDGSK